MIKNNIRIALRNLFKHKGFSFINIFGLALGTVCCLYILLYLRDEYSYDRHHDGVDRIYRITTELGAMDDPKRMATCSPPIPGAMKREFPEVEEATRFVGMFTGNQQIFHLGEQVFYETDGVYADSTFFQVFTYSFIRGNPQRALAKPNDIVLSEETSMKFFGRTDVVGEVLELHTGEGKRNLTVTGVVSGNGEHKSHIRANYFLSMDSGGIGSYAMVADDWVGNNFTNAYIKLKPNASVAGLQEKLPAFLERHAGDKMVQRATEKRLLLQPVTEVHTTTGLDAEPSKPTSPTLLSILMAIAGMIQLIACINFMNLATSRATKRALEVGVRKVVGANRKALIAQFLSESLLVSFMAMAVAVPLVTLLLPLLNKMTGVVLAPDFSQEPVLWIGIIILGLVTGLLAGSYPAFYLSGFRLEKVLKSQISLRRGGHGRLRQALVVFQFVIAISLIVGVVIINSQLKYIQQQDLGYEPAQKLVLPFRTDDALLKADNYRDAILQFPGIRSVSRANNYPGKMVFNDQSFYPGGKGMKDAVNVKFMRVDEHFINTLGIELLQGRDFKPTDTSGVILANETMLRRMEIPVGSAAGEHIYSDLDDRVLDLEIAGVVHDFNFSSLYSEVTPFMLLYDPSAFHGQMIIDAETDDYTQLISQLESTWEARVPDVPFEYSFIDEDVMKHYEGDRRLSRIISSFTFLTILISCLGLLGLVIFTTEQRTKEIGIRKVLGASVASIVALLSKDLILLVLLASIVAFPLAGYFMNIWLQEFAYQIGLQWWMFALAGMTILAIAVLTVSFQSVRAALANPVKALRSE